MAKIFIRTPPSGGPRTAPRAAVLHGGLLAAVGGEGDFVCAVRVAQPEVAVSIKCLPLPVRRESRGELPSARRSGSLIARLASSSSPSRVAALSGRLR